MRERKRERNRSRDGEANREKEEDRDLDTHRYTEKARHRQGPLSPVTMTAISDPIPVPCVMNLE